MTLGRPLDGHIGVLACVCLRIWKRAQCAGQVFVQSVFGALHSKITPRGLLTLQYRGKLNGVELLECSRLLYYDKTIVSMHDCQHLNVRGSKEDGIVGVWIIRAERNDGNGVVSSVEPCTRSKGHSWLKGV